MSDQLDFDELTTLQLDKLIVVGAAASGPVVWLALGALPMLWALTLGVVLDIRGTFEPAGRSLSA